VWTGPAASDFVDVQPQGSASGRILAAAGGEFAGSTTNFLGVNSAALWTGPDASDFVNLGANLTSSVGYRIVDGEGVALGTGPPLRTRRPSALWWGRAAGSVVAHVQRGRGTSAPFLVAAGGEFVGNTPTIPGLSPAALWTGPDASDFVNLNVP